MKKNVPSKGFTLVELLVVVTIIAVLAAIGTVVFRSGQLSSRDAKRKADINAIAKAMETKFNAETSTYTAPTNADFAAGIPDDPRSGVNYTVGVASDSRGFAACAALEASTESTCRANAADCYCKYSAQGAGYRAISGPASCANLTGTTCKMLTSVIGSGPYPDVVYINCPATAINCTAAGSSGTVTYFTEPIGGTGTSATLYSNDNIANSRSVTARIRSTLP